MKTRIIATLVTALALIACKAPPPKVQAVGVNGEVANNVLTHAQAEAAWRAAQVGGQVNYLDSYETGAASHLRIDLVNKSVFTMGADAGVTIDKFVYDPNQSATGVTFAVSKGLFRFVSGSRGAAPETVSLRTPTASIGIRGTIAEGVVGPQALELLTQAPGMTDLTGDPATAAVIILREGAIDVTVAPKTVSLTQPGQAVAVFGQQLSDPFFLTDTANQWFAARLPGGPTPPPAAGPPPAIVPPPPVSSLPPPRPRPGGTSAPVTPILSGPAPGPLSGPVPGPVSGPVPGPLSGPVSGPVPGPLSGPVKPVADKPQPPQKPDKPVPGYVPDKPASTGKPGVGSPYPDKPQPGPVTGKPLPPATVAPVKPGIAVTSPPATSPPVAGPAGAVVRPGPSISVAPPTTTPSTQTPTGTVVRPGPSTNLPTTNNNNRPPSTATTTTTTNGPGKTTTTTTTGPAKTLNPATAVLAPTTPVAGQTPAKPAATTPSPAAILGVAPATTAAPATVTPAAKAAPKIRIPALKIGPKAKDPNAPKDPADPQPTVIR